MVVLNRAGVAERRSCPPKFHDFDVACASDSELTRGLAVIPAKTTLALKVFSTIHNGCRRAKGGEGNPRIHLSR